MSAPCPIMHDAEVAKFFGISTRTLQRRVNSPVKGELDLNDAGPQIVGGRRYWLRERVERLAGIGEKPERKAR